VPEKDGILACLLMCELVAYEGKPLKRILAEIMAQTTTILSDRINLRVTPQRKDELLRKFAAGLNDFAGRKVKDTVTVDGYKFLLDDGSWVMFRASGTEPVFRCYLEGKTKKQLAAYRNAALELVK